MTLFLVKNCDISKSATFRENSECLTEKEVFWIFLSYFLITVFYFKCTINFFIRISKTFSFKRLFLKLSFSNDQTV